MRASVAVSPRFLPRLRGRLSCAGFFFTDSGVSVDDSRCIECGDCLLVCPAEAITGITPRKRFLCGDTLVGPFTDRAPGVNELLLWHAQHHVRFISIDAEQNPDWLLAIARLNLALRRRGEAAWAFKHIPVNEVNTARRALMHVPVRMSSPASCPASVSCAGRFLRLARQR